jgi:hypothetical protein
MLVKGLQLFKKETQKQKKARQTPQSFINRQFQNLFLLKNFQ